MYRMIVNDLIHLKMKKFMGAIKVRSGRPIPPPNFLLENSHRLMYTQACPPIKVHFCIIRNIM